MAMVRMFITSFARNKTGIWSGDAYIATCSSPLNAQSVLLTLYYHTRCRFINAFPLALCHQYRHPKSRRKKNLPISTQAKRNNSSWMAQEGFWFSATWCCAWEANPPFSVWPNARCSRLCMVSASSLLMLFGALASLSPTLAATSS